MTTAAWFSTVACAAAFCCFPRASPAAGSPLDRPIEATWRHAPLAERLERLEAAGYGVAFRDRRVDPRTRLTLSAQGSLRSVLREAVAPFGYAVSELGGAVYIGPSDVSRQLRTLAERNRQQASNLPASQQQSLRRRDALSWPRLTEPRALIVTLAEAHGLRVANPERVPHDVWDAGKLPAMALSDRLTLLLVGFDLTWRPAQGGGLEFVRPAWPVLVRRTHRARAGVEWNEDAFRQAFPSAVLTRQGRGWTLEGTLEAHERLGAILRGDQRVGEQPPRNGVERRLTLTVREQPAMAVLRYLAKTLQLSIAGQESFDAAVNGALATRVNLALEQATLEQTLTEIGQQTGLAITLEGEAIVVR